MTDYSITELDISKKELIQLPDDIDKYTNLLKLCCQVNQLTSLNNLQPNLKELYCGNNPLIYDFEPSLKKIRSYNATRKLSSNT